MPYLSIDDFRFGMDRRRERVAGIPGTLWTAKNGHITRGGDFESVKAFVSTYVLPANTLGLSSIRSQLYVFGSDAVTGMPAGVRYQQLVPPAGNMIEVLDAKAFRGQLYVIAEYDTGDVYHFLNGVRLTDWDAVASDSASFEALAALLASKISSNDAAEAHAFGSEITVTARVPGTGFAISASAVNGGGVADQTAIVTTLQANVVEVAETRASATIAVTGGSLGVGTNEISSLTINGVALLSAAVPWRGSNAATAIRLSQTINNSSSTHGYYASVVDATVTVAAAPGTGIAPNGYVVAATTGGNVTVTASATMAGGVAAVAAVAQVSKVTFGGTFEVADTFSVVIDSSSYKATGRASGTGRSAFVYFSRIWVPVASLWRYSMLERGDIWDPNHLPAVTDNDAGFINVASDAEGNEDLTVGGQYQGLGAVFSPQTITLYRLDTDPTNFAFDTTLDNTGTEAPASMVRYGNNDVFYLDPTGVRSLRARDASNAPFVSDVGNAIDTFVQETLAELTEEQKRRAKAVIEPLDGRYWLAVGERIFVLSFFAGAKISAWSYYEPGFEIDAFARVRRRIYARAGDVIYLYGGSSGTEYPETNDIDVEFPFLAGQKAATRKVLDGYDVALTNEWEVTICVDPNDTNKTINVGRINGVTYNMQDIALGGLTGMMAVRMRCTRGGRATISMSQLHYDEEEAR